ncbi:MAG: Asp23/Gls24 family envelope stress response protein [Firmicutes bacterium]|nr:Asp23/Gls24 family envelope stress response protein [Bacillota bacterium]
MLELTTDFGTITVSKNVISRIISEAVDEFEGEVHLTNRKGKPLKLKNESGFVENSSAMDIKLSGDGIYIRFFVLMKIGMSISAVTNRMFDYITEEILAATGMTPAEMAIVITGMYTKEIKNVGKRNIEVKR